MQAQIRGCGNHQGSSETLLITGLIIQKNEKTKRKKHFITAIHAINSKDFRAALGLPEKLQSF